MTTKNKIGRPRVNVWVPLLPPKAEDDPILQNVGVDKGCEYFASCRECLLPVCKEEVSSCISLIQLLDHWFMAARINVGEVDLHQEAARVGVSVRCVYRRLRAYRVVNGDLWQFLRPHLNPKAREDKEIQEAIERFGAAPLPYEVEVLLGTANQ